MQLGMLGCGYVANMYRLTLPLHPELRLIGVHDRDESRASLMAGLTGSQNYPSLHDMLADDRVELVLNLTNPQEHYATTKKCLEAGKHVFSEKPLAMRLDDAKELVAIAEQKRLSLSSAPCTLLNEAAQTLWKAVRERKVGEIRLVYAEMDDGMVHRMPVKKWVNETGIAWPYRNEFETGCTLEHAGYVLTWLAAYFGPAASISALSTTLVGDKMPGEKIESAPDFSVSCIQFHSGVVARLSCGVYAPRDHTLTLCGDDGVIVVKDPRCDLSPVRIRRFLRFGRALKLSPWSSHYPLTRSGRKQVRYRGSQQRDFCSGIAEMSEALLERRPCRLSAAFCLHVNEMVLAIQNSSGGMAPYQMTTTFEPIVPMHWARTDRE